MRLLQYTHVLVLIRPRLVRVAHPDTKSQGPGLARPSRPARQLAQHRRSGALAHPSMSLIFLAEEDVPLIPMEQQEAIISVLSVVSSALLLAIIAGAGESQFATLSVTWWGCYPMRSSGTVV